ncbi:hypothetical protein FACS189441_5600 [Betaproteobacteria bacterium]|nr:hypothetical protein FACS189441_5600 [Betaproteobacteria bacterium]
MPVSSVTFDLDGTLLDTARDIFVACQRVLAEMRQPARSEADIRRFVGRGMDELITRCLFWDAPPTHADVEEGMRLFRRFYVEENGRATQAYPGVVAGLRAFHASGLPLAVVTNKSAAFTRPLFDCVCDLLEQSWSPQQIAGRLRHMHPDKPDWHIAHRKPFTARFTPCRVASCAAS